MSFLLPLTFETRHARTRRGWVDFYRSRDLFLHEMLKRRGQGLTFGHYVAPDKTTVDAILTPEDIRQHSLILGGTGTGKSSLLEALARFHFAAGQGFVMIDLHGDLFARVAAWAEHGHVPNVTLLDFTKPDAMPSWNPLKQIPDIDVGRHVDLLVGVLKRLYASEKLASWSWGVKVEELMRYALRACIESRTMATLVDLKSFFLLPVLRQELLATCSDETRGYFARFGRREEMYIGAVLNKLDPFMSSVAVQRFLGSPTPTMDLFQIVDRSETLLVNLPRGYLGSSTADVVGRLLVNFLQVAALRREAMPMERRKPFSIILDEAHNLAGPDSGLEDLLVAARKYRVFVTLAAQNLHLFPPGFRAHVLGNAYRQFFFRMPHSEAKALASELFEAQGNLWREPVRPYDELTDPLLTPSEEIDARISDLASLPIGDCYWLLKGRRFKGRRIKITAPISKVAR
ncbi:MAG TPA: DUF87 domain-containing protein [Thermoanaerobaculia bacterium]|nr:DUF87 domain-containing protein [Thermoanaerobaculia bacterium]